MPLGKEGDMIAPEMLAVHRLPRMLAVAGLSLVLLTACGSSSGDTKAPPDADGAGQASSSAATSDAAAVDGCTLVSAAELSDAVGVTYTTIDSVNGGSLCNITGASPKDSFSYHIDKEDGTVITWDDEAATIERDDGTSTAVSGIGDRAVQGAIKEFAAESKGYIVVVLDADVNNPPTADDFTRSKKIALTLISRL